MLDKFAENKTELLLNIIENDVRLILSQSNNQQIITALYFIIVVYV